MFKGGKKDRSKAENCRPILLMYISCEVLEHILHKNIIKYLKINNILTDIRHGITRITNKRKVIKYRYLLHNVILKEVSNAKYLGVIMNTRLSRKKHVQEICGKANQTRQFLQRNLVTCKPETKLL